MRTLALFSLCGIIFGLLFWIVEWIHPATTLTGWVGYTIMEWVVPIFFLMTLCVALIVPGIDKLAEIVIMKMMRRNGAGINQA